MRQKRSRSLNKMKNTLTVAILVVCLKTGSGLLNQKPRDSVAIAGKSAYFNCSTSEPSKPILWYHYSTNEVHRETIYQYANFTDYWYPCYRKGRYVVEKNPATGAFNLVLPMVLLSDAGRYLCEVEGDEGMATLTVQVESNPTCVASEICKPYIKWYSVAIFCIIVIILLIAIGGTISVLWYLRVYRPKEHKTKGCKMEAFEEEAPRSSLIVSSQGNKEADAHGKMTNTEVASPEETEQQLLLHPTNNLTTKTRTFETQPERGPIEGKVLNNQLSGVRITLQEKNKAPKSETRHLEPKVMDPEQSPYPAGNFDYAENPTLVHTIITNAGKQRREPINGMAILGNDLFVSHENNSEIEVYYMETFQFGLKFEVEGMSHPMDIASCKEANCLYIIHRGDSDSKGHIAKTNSGGKLIKNWRTGGDRGRLSTYGSNVIVCLFEKQMINEYTRDGLLIHTVHLSPDSGFNHPWHAIKVTSCHFAVCHGDEKDELHRVCIIDARGTIVKELKEWESKIKDGKLNVPICLVRVEGCELSILVADRDSQKIRRLDSSLESQNNLIGKGMGLDGNPVRMCLHEEGGRLCVAANTLSGKESKGGRIFIFNIK